MNPSTRRRISALLPRRPRFVPAATPTMSSRSRSVCHGQDRGEGHSLVQGRWLDFLFPPRGTRPRCGRRLMPKLAPPSWTLGSTPSACGSGRRLLAAGLLADLWQRSLFARPVGVEEGPEVQVDDARRQERTCSVQDLCGHPEAPDPGSHPFRGLLTRTRRTTSCSTPFPRRGRPATSRREGGAPAR